MNRSLFVTGFGPFLEVTENPSAELAASSGYDYEILPVTYDAVEEFLSRFKKTGYEKLLLIGVAMLADLMRLELFGRNQLSAIADVSGVIRTGKIDTYGPPLLPTQLWRGISLMKLASPHVCFSRSAGNYICNYFTYRALQELPDRQVGFLHIPSFESIPRDIQEENLKRIIELL